MYLTILIKAKQNKTVIHSCRQSRLRTRITEKRSAYAYVNATIIWSTHSLVLYLLALDWGQSLLLLVRQCTPFSHFQFCFCYLNSHLHERILPIISYFKYLSIVCKYLYRYNKRVVLYKIYTTQELYIIWIFPCFPLS